MTCLFIISDNSLSNKEGREFIEAILSFPFSEQQSIINWRRLWWLGKKSNVIFISPQTIFLFSGYKKQNKNKTKGRRRNQELNFRLKEQEEQKRKGSLFTSRI